MKENCRPVIKNAIDRQTTIRRCHTHFVALNMLKSKGSPVNDP